MPSWTVRQQFPLLNNVENITCANSTHRTKSFIHWIKRSKIARQGFCIVTMIFLEVFESTELKKNLCFVIVTVGRVVGQLTGKSQRTGSGSVSRLGSVSRPRLRSGLGLGLWVRLLVDIGLGLWVLMVLSTKGSNELAFARYLAYNLLAELSCTTRWIVLSHLKRPWNSWKPYF